MSGSPIPHHSTDLRSAELETAERLFGELDRFGSARAVVAGDRTLSHAQLVAEAADFAATLGPGRRLVLLTGGRDLASLIAYVGVVAHGHVALMAGPHPEHLDRLVERYRPDTVVHGGRITSHHTLPAHDLHPDLAVLLSTSGSTGSPKLVRLSQANLRHNAEAIADYLALRSDDLAITTLPWHYCYGLSVLHSHLQRGAAVLLDENSVVDPCFWDAVRQHRVTSLAGVPHTFDMLDRTDFADLDLPHLRQITQAGGRLAPDRVRSYAELGQSRGFDFVVMYGATEATARMAWLPPELAIEHPDAVGLPIPGGRFEISPLPDHPDGTGELLFHGPNVMMGYAESPGDLALAPGPQVLRTGDIARLGTDGLVRIIGRRSRFTKVFGLRIDLDEAERTLATHGVTARCADAGDRLVVAVLEPDPDALVARVAHAAWGLPAHAVQVVTASEIPRLANGKVDYPSLVDRARVATTGQPETESGLSPTERIRACYAEVLGRDSVTTEDSFAGLGGDSLSYVETSLRLEAELGHLPHDWHLRTIGALGALAVTDSSSPNESPQLATQQATQQARRRWRTLETSVVLRAVAILAIVATHGNLLTVLGGAHLLIGISGYHFARFAPQGTPGEVLRRRATSIARIVVPSVLWIGAVTVVFGTYPWRSVLLVNGLVGPAGWSEPAWHFWFIEALVALLVPLSLLTAWPWWRRVEARWGFWLPFALACVALVTRFELWEPRDGDDIHRAHMLLWLFAIGWAGARIRTLWQRCLLSALVLLTVPGFFDNTPREAFVGVGLLLLLWVPHVRVPAAVARAAAVLATSSLYIYLTHWQVYPWLEDRAPVLAVLASLAVGIAVTRLVEAAQRRAQLSSVRFRPARFRSARAAAPASPAVPVAR